MTGRTNDAIDISRLNNIAEWLSITHCYAGKEIPRLVLFNPESLATSPHMVRRWASPARTESFECVSTTSPLEHNLVSNFAVFLHDCHGPVSTQKPMQGPPGLDQMGEGPKASRGIAGLDLKEPKNLLLLNHQVFEVLGRDG